MQVGFQNWILFVLKIFYSFRKLLVFFGVYKFMMNIEYFRIGGFRSRFWGG